MFKLFILLATMMPGQDMPQHSITIESAHLYPTERQCIEAAEKTGFIVHPAMGPTGASYKCIQVKNNSDGKIIMNELKV